MLQLQVPWASRSRPRWAYVAVFLLISLTILFTGWYHHAGLTYGKAYGLSAPWTWSTIDEEWLALDTRLDDWLNAPIPSAEDMARLGETLCPAGLGGRDENSFHIEEQAYWSSITTGDVKRARQDLVDWVRAARERGEIVIWPETEAKDKTRGMILTGGNGHTMRRVALTLDLVRNVYHSQVPVEIFSFADEVIDERDKEMIERFGKVSFKTIEGKKTGAKRHYIKGRAFVQNSFDEFLYIDSDSIPTQNISQYFDSVEYTSQGSVFWPDIYKDHSANAIWRIIDEPCGGDWAQETGQVLFDRTGNSGWNQAVLLLADRMQTQGDFWYHFSYGDKDTWRYAFRMLGLPTPTSGRSYSPLGGYLDRNGKKQDQFCGHTMLQWGLTPQDAPDDPNYHPEPGFAHANMLKYHESYNGEVDVFSQLQRAPIDALTEPSLERLKYAFIWDARCLSIESQHPEEEGPLTIPFEDAFLPGREQQVLAIRRLANQLSQLGSEPLKYETE